MWTKEEARKLKEWCLDPNRKFGDTFYRTRRGKGAIPDVLCIGQHSRGILFSGNPKIVNDYWKVCPDEIICKARFCETTGYDWDELDEPEIKAEQHPAMYTRFYAPDKEFGSSSILSDFNPEHNGYIVEYKPARIVPQSEIDAAKGGE